MVCQRARAAARKWTVRFYMEGLPSHVPGQVPTLQINASLSSVPLVRNALVPHATQK